jgi:hypothetical protein
MHSAESHIICVCKEILLKFVKNMSTILYSFPDVLIILQFNYFFEPRLNYFRDYSRCTEAEQAIY